MSSPVGIDLSGPVHVMEIFSGLTPSTASIIHIRDSVSPAVELPSATTVTSSEPRSVVEKVWDGNVVDIMQETLTFY